jgi:outer membrane receptor protein involved in Fe transport
MEMNFDNFQKGLLIREDNYSENGSSTANIRWGTDFYFGKNHTLGFLVSGQLSDGTGNSDNNIEIYPGSEGQGIDSILVAQNSSSNSRDQGTFNLNYVYDDGESTVNIDADYGTYNRENATFQPNQYFLPDGVTPITRIETRYLTPVDIDIYTFKVDVEKPLAGGKLGFGTKLSSVRTKNTFLFYDILNNVDVRNNRRSNLFDYDENVYAGYVNYSKALSEKWNFSSGLRVEKTDASGNLQAFVSDLEEPAVELNYTNFFPSLGLTYSLSQEHIFSINYGRRINRPDYNVLNPFREQQSELSFYKGNPFLKPEIVNNFELGYTLNYRYNFKLSYSKTTDQITRLIAPDEIDPRANFVNWDNLASQTIIGGNISAPFQVNSWWNAFINFSSGYLNNQADYGEGAVVDVQAFTYSIFQQHTITLPSGFTGEVSGYFSGPGVWGGVFQYDETWSLNLGLQRKFLDNKVNMRLSVQDIFYQTGFQGSSSFNGLVGTGSGNWDSRRVSLSLSYNFGNNKVKSRNRKTGIESESSRVGQ